MDDFVLDVWRIAGRHREIALAGEHLAGLLGQRVPADALVLRAFDLAAARLDTVLSAACRPGVAAAVVPAARCTHQRFARALDWCRSGGTVAPGSAEDDEVRQVVLPGRPPGDWTVAPVPWAEPPGALALRAVPGRGFTRADLALVEAILEPVGLLLTTHARLQELARLREAREADTRTLLSKLDRDTISDVVVGAETGLRDVMDQVEQAGPGDAPVLLLGEAGTGKEVIARALHARSSRAAGPVLRVNCGTLPPTLVEPELFGQARAAGGPQGVRRGWVERADGGTLLLDDIHDLPPGAQQGVLRAIRDGTLRRTGAQEPVAVDVRIIAGTDRDLAECVAAGRFLEPLWRWLSTITIHLPPLRDRLQDLGALAAHFAWRAGRRLGGRPLAPTAADVELLAAYAWPGNIRELASVIERAVILGQGRELRLAAALGHMADTTQSARDRGELETLDAAMARHIEHALRACHGRVEGPLGAAARLGVNPNTLRARMRKLGLQASRFRLRR